MPLALLLASVLLVSACFGRATPELVKTTSGLLRGQVEANGVLSFKGIRFAHPATGDRRWEPPAPFVSTVSQNATHFGPACVQQFNGITGALDERVFNNPSNPPVEDEDCLFLNVWKPATDVANLPVLVWIYGGGLAFGTASVPEYDGLSISANEKLIMVSFNYRTNVFGFPGAPDLPLTGNNLGFLDQELAFKWVQENIAQFGGDPQKVTIMGQSAGSQSTSAAISRHSADDAPFRAAIMLSGADVSTSPIPSFAAFDSFAAAVGCTQVPGATRLACLRRVPSAVIRTFTNQLAAPNFLPLIDNVTLFSDPLQRIRTGKTARVPFILGNTQDDGTIVSVNLPDNLTAALDEFVSPFARTTVTADQVRPLYPGLNDTAIIAATLRDILFLCPASLWTAAAVDAGIADVHRYAYGPVFADLQLFPGAGAWHSSELPEIFGTFNRSTATASEVTLSGTMQNIVGNFVRNPTVSPALNWPKYIPGSATKTLAKLAYNGNVLVDDVLQAVQSDSLDTPCAAFWNQFLDVRF
ncbi:Carboxylesterase [Roridomyces roridus]|uniref:Carboxylic ester hydrolase n=1 Tax=Roridomyces roridus TaxID=1738132 RepID=A0AAD7BTK5_9AGAR|nr:Carboxylesterase [Roridomyces roridus]